MTEKGGAAGSARRGARAGIYLKTSSFINGCCFITGSLFESETTGEKGRNQGKRVNESGGVGAAGSGSIWSRSRRSHLRSALSCRRSQRIALKGSMAFRKAKACCPFTLFSQGRAEQIRMWNFILTGNKNKAGRSVEMPLSAAFLCSMYNRDEKICRISPAFKKYHQI